MRFLRTYRKPAKLEFFTTLLLILSTILALAVYNSPLRGIYKYIFDKTYIFSSFTLHTFINDFLMSIFFLVAGLEIKYEILHGNLSSLKKSSFPVLASIGGVVVPALIFFHFNKNTPYLNGICIPISTDIAFAVGLFSIFRKKLNTSLKIFLLSLAIVDDLISIAAIGIIYSLDLNLDYFTIALIILCVLCIANLVFNVESITYYLIGGACLWYFIHLSGVHSTVSGILLALAIPSKSTNYSLSTLERLQRVLVPINSLIVIPLFAFANTGISLNYNLDFSKAPTLSLGIIVGLCVGKPLGIMLFSYISCLLGIAEKPSYINWSSIFLVSLIAGVGFTMSIFISEIAFIRDAALINIAKMSILMSALISLCSTSMAILIYSFISKKYKGEYNHNSNKYRIS